MANKKKQNERCPLQAECEKVCKWQGHELDCKYYFDFARPGYEIEDPERIRFEREDAAMMAAYEDDDDDGGGDFCEREQHGDVGYRSEDPLLGFDVDGSEDSCQNDASFAESPSAAENAAVAPPEAADEVLPVLAEVVPKSLHLDGSNGVTEKIKRAMYDAARQFVYIGFLLWEVQEYGYYREKGYASVYEYAEKELGFKKSSTKNFVAINYEFGSRNGRPSGIAHERTMSLQSQYQQFNYSQLCEMLSMSDKQRSQVTPDMTVKQIRELKREGEPDLPPNMETIPIPLPDDPASDPGQTSGQYRSCTVNNVWHDLPVDLLKSLTMFSGVRYNPRSHYDITITLHKDT